METATEDRIAPHGALREEMVNPDFIPLWTRYEVDLGRLDDAALGELVRAMFIYAREGIEVDLQGPGYYVWPTVRKDIDYSRKSYANKVAAGRKGGSRKKTVKSKDEALAEDRIEENSKADPKQSQADPKQTQADPKQNQLNHNHNQNHNQPHSQNQKHSSASIGAPGEAAAAGNDDFVLGRQVVTAFYEERDDLDRPNHLSKKTLRRAQELAGQYAMENIRLVFRKSRSGFLNGQGEKGWKATLNWLLEEDHFQDVLQGRYDMVISKGAPAPVKREDPPEYAAPPPMTEEQRENIRDVLKKVGLDGWMKGSDEG